MVSQVHFLEKFRFWSPIILRIACNCPSPVVFTIFAYSFRRMARGWTPSVVPLWHCHILGEKKYRLVHRTPIVTSNSAITVLGPGRPKCAFFLLQDICSINPPISQPQWPAGSLMHSRVLVLIPSPQVTLHSLYSDQADHLVDFLLILISLSSFFTRNSNIICHRTATVTITVNDQNNEGSRDIAVVVNLLRGLATVFS